MSQDISPIGDQFGKMFDRTVMMMKIDKLEQEVALYQDALKDSASSVASLSSIMGRYSETFSTASILDDKSWDIFLETVKKYDNDLLELSLIRFSDLRAALQEFLRFKLGFAYAEAEGK